MGDERRWTIYKRTGEWDDVIEGPDTAKAEVVEAPVLEERDRTITELRKALFECAVQSGEDTSGGVPTWPPIGAWAVDAVKQLRAAYDEACVEPDSESRKAEKELEGLRSQLTEARAALERIANTDFRGNRPQESVMAFEALKRLVPAPQDREPAT